MRWGSAVLIAVSGVLLVASPVGGQGEASRVLVTSVAGPITPVISGHVADGIRRAEDEGYAAYVIELDTPGGLDSSMRAIVQDLLDADVPVIVHIGPRGARGASAGAIITLAGHVASMAPGTSIGAATPVAGGAGEDLDRKVVNEAAAYAASIAELRGRNIEFANEAVTEGRSIGYSEALELGVIDVVASSVEQLLDDVDGTVVDVDGDEVELSTAGAAVDEQGMGVLRSIQQFLADPNIAFLLMSIGTLALIYELASPGIGVGGALGATFILVGLFGLAVLPVNVVGVMFLLLAAAMFVAELFVPGVGLAAAGGALSLVLAGVFLFDDAPGLELSLAVVLPSAAVVAAFVIVAGRFVVPLRHAPSTTTGSGLLVGQLGRVHARGRLPQALIGGAWWTVRPVRSDEELREGDAVKVVDVDGLELVVDVVDDVEVVDRTSTGKDLTE